MNKFSRQFKILYSVLALVLIAIIGIVPGAVFADSLPVQAAEEEKLVAYELPKLDDKLDYYQVVYPEGLRYSSSWSGTFTYVPNNITTVLYDDSYLTGWGICVLGVPAKSSPPSGPQGGTSISKVTIDYVDALLKGYTTERLVKPFDSEIQEVMSYDHYYVGAWAGEKLNQKWDYQPYQNTYEEWERTDEGWVQVEKKKVLTERQQAYIDETSKAKISVLDIEKYDPDRYFVMGQVFFTDGTADCSIDGRAVADSAFTVAAAGNFTIHMANGTTGTVSGTNIQGTPVSLSAGLNTITATDAVADGLFDITIGTAANTNSVNSWSAASGGACGASVPTNADSALFNANSFTAASQVVTVDANLNCLDMDWTGATNNPTLAGTAALNIYGNRTYIAAMNITYTGTVTYKATAGTKTITSNTKVSLSPTVFNGAGGTFQLLDKFTLGGTANLTLTAGTFDANGQEVALNGTAHTINGNFTFATLTRNGTATKTNTVTFTSGTTVTCTTCAMIGNSSTNRLLMQSSTLGTATTITATNWTGTANVDIMDITATNAVDLSAITGGSGDCGGNTGITFTTAAAQISAATGNWSTLATWQDGAGTDRVPLPQDDVSCSHTVTVDMPRIGKSITFTGTPTITLANSVANYGSLTMGSDMTYTHANNVNVMRGRGAYNLDTAGKALGNLSIYAPGGKVTLQSHLSAIATSFLTLGAGELDTGIYNISTNNVRFAYLAGLTFTLNLGSGTHTITGTSTVWDTSGGGTPVLVAGTSTIVLSGSNATARTFAGGGLTYNNVTVQGLGAYALTVTGNNTFNNFYVNANQAGKAIIATGTTQTVNDFTRNTAFGTNVVTITNGTWSKHGRIVNGTGTFTGSPIYINDLTETITCTGNGTAIVYLPAGVTGNAISGVAGATVTDSPKALVPGANTINVTMAGNNTFTIESNSIDSIPTPLDYLNVSGSTAVPDNVWYAGSNSVDLGGNTGWIFDDPELVVTTQAVTGLTMDATGVTGGTLNGTVTTLLEGTPTITTYFEYGLTNAYGAQTADVIIHDDGTFTGTVPADLTPGATYHFRAVAANGNAASPYEGADDTFTLTMPTGIQLDATNIAFGDGTTATLNGRITDMGKASTTYYLWDWGYDLTYGNTTALTITAAAGDYSMDITGINPLHTVFYRFGVRNGTTTTWLGASTFDIEGSSVAGYQIMYIILPIIICLGAAITIFWAWGRSGSWTVIIIAAIVACLGPFLIHALLQSLW